VGAPPIKRSYVVDVAHVKVIVTVSSSYVPEAPEAAFHNHQLQRAISYGSIADN
jgi:hypothetical protein